MPTTSNFGWTTPADTDYVKDGALAIRTLANGIDTSLVDLKGGTTGQILSKNSNTDLDYTWINNDQGDITNVAVTSPITGGGSSGSVTIGIQDGTTTQKGAVQLENSTSSTSTSTAAVPASVKSAYDLANGAIAKSLIDAEGDLIVGDAADAVQRLAIGTTGQVLTVDTAVDGKIKWAAASSGALTKISTTSLSGASSYDWTDVFTSTYAEYLIIIDRCNMASGNGSQSLRMRARYGSTTDDGAGQYYQGGKSFTYTGGTTDLAISGGSYFQLNAETGDGQLSKNVIYVDGVGTGGNTRMVITNTGFSGQDSGSVTTAGSVGQTARNYTGFRLYSSGGSNFSATVYLYGVEK